MVCSKNKKNIKMNRINEFMKQNNDSALVIRETLTRLICFQKFVLNSIQMATFYENVFNQSKGSWHRSTSTKTSKCQGEFMLTDKVYYVKFDEYFKGYE